MLWAFLHHSSFDEFQTGKSVPWAGPRDQLGQSQASGRTWKTPASPLAITAAESARVTGRIFWITLNPSPRAAATHPHLFFRPPRPFPINSGTTSAPGGFQAQAPSLPRRTRRTARPRTCARSGPPPRPRAWCASPAGTCRCAGPSCAAPRGS